MTVIGHNHYLAQTVGELTPTETTALAPESLSIGIRVADLSVEAANFIVELANQQPADSARVYRVMAPGTNSAFLP